MSVALAVINALTSMRNLIATVSANASVSWIWPQRAGKSTFPIEAKAACAPRKTMALSDGNQRGPRL
jgi:hypothetical protein